MSDEQDGICNVPFLVAVIRAARVAEDSELERTARRELKKRFGIGLKLPKQTAADPPSANRA